MFFKLIVSVTHNCVTIAHYNIVKIVRMCPGHSSSLMPAGNKGKMQTTGFPCTLENPGNKKNPEFFFYLLLALLANANRLKFMRMHVGCHLIFWATLCPLQHPT